MLESFQYLYIINFIDVFEILIFSFVIYYFSLWLKQDSQKKLLSSFYLIFSTIFVTQFFQMNVLHNFLIYFFPAIIMLFILVHQKVLQKNFISLLKITPEKQSLTDWLEILMRSSLIAMNNKKQIIGVIEGKDSLSTFLTSSFTMNTPINKDVLEVIFNSPSYDQNKMIWISQNGFLNAINSDWNIKNHDLWISKEIQGFENWKQDAILLTSKIDALIFKTNPTKQNFDIIIFGKIIDNVLPNNAVQIIQQFVRKNNLDLKKGSNEINFKTTSTSNQPLA